MSHRQRLTLHTDDGVDLVAELATPAAGGDAPAVRGSVVFLHPLPTHGGSMDSHLVRKAAARLPDEHGVAVLRLNTRGTASPEGRSGGAFDAAVGERHDVVAAVDAAREAGLPAPWLVGWSFGSDLVLRYGLLPTVRGAVLLSPTLRWSLPEHRRAWAADGRPLVAVLAERDTFLAPDDARRELGLVPQAEVHVLPGAVHLLHGRADQVLGLLAATVAAAR